MMLASQKIQAKKDSNMKNKNNLDIEDKDDDDETTNRE